MEVRIVEFPGATVAVLEHHGPPDREYETARKLIAWRIRNRLHPDRHRSYGIHYTDPRTTPGELHRVGFCVSFEGEVAPNPEGVVTGVIPPCRCAVTRYIGSRNHIAAAVTLHDEWLPASGETRSEFPMFFHYVNVGPDIREPDMITDVYLPLRRVAGAVDEPGR
jgi:AraC family transcriptional regulator